MGRRLEQRRNKKATKEARYKETKAKTSDYAMKVQARERFLNSGGTWYEWVSGRKSGEIVVK